MAEDAPDGRPDDDAQAVDLFNGSIDTGEVDSDVRGKGFYVLAPAAQAHAEAIQTRDQTALRQVEYDLRRRLQELTPVVLKRMRDVAGKPMSPNAFEGLLRQGNGKGVTLSPESLTLLLHLMGPEDAWDEKTANAVKPFYADVKAGEAA